MWNKTKSSIQARGAASVLCSCDRGGGAQTKHCHSNSPTDWANTENGCLFSQLPGLSPSLTYRLALLLRAQGTQLCHWFRVAVGAYVLTNHLEGGLCHLQHASCQVLEGTHALALPETVLKGWAKARAEGARGSSQHWNGSSATVGMNLVCFSVGRTLQPLFRLLLGTASGPDSVCGCTEGRWGGGG